jgi:transposase
MDAYARRTGPRENTLRVDVDTGTPLVTLQGRRADDVVGWCRSRPHEAWASVEGVGWEMSKTYAAALQALWGESGQVIARLPVVPWAVNALDEVWRSVHQPRETEEATARKKRRRRWRQSANQRQVDAWIARDEWRRRFPPRRERIDGVQDVRRWLERQEEQPAREALLPLIERASQSAQAPLQRMAGTLTRWCEPMVHDLRHRYSNGLTEGLNNKIKRIQRMASGLRNEHHRRKRILAWCGKIEAWPQ